MHERLIGAGVGAGATAAAALVDINFAAVAGGMTIFGTAGVAIYYSFNQTRLKIFRETAEAKIQVQKQQEEANRESLSAKVKKLEDTLASKRKQWHDQYDVQTGMLDKVRADLLLAQLRVAKLEGQLGIIDKSHAEGINANTKNIDVVAARAGIQLPTHPPPVEPILPPQADDNHDVLDPSDDDISPFFRP